MKDCESSRTCNAWSLCTWVSSCWWYQQHYPVCRTHDHLCTEQSYQRSRIKRTHHTRWWKLEPQNWSIYRCKQDAKAYRPRLMQSQGMRAYKKSPCWAHMRRDNSSNCYSYLSRYPPCHRSAKPTRERACATWHRMMRCEYGSTYKPN